MTAVAYDSRRRGQIVARRVRYLAAEAPRRLLRMQLPTGVSTIGVLASRDHSERVLTDALTRLAWAVPEAIEILSSTQTVGSPPSWAGIEIGDLSGRLIESDPRQADLVLMADASRTRWLGRAFGSRTLIGDPTWYSGVEVETFAEISSLGTTPREWKEIEDQSSRIMTDLLVRFAGAATVSVFGTGPSMTSIDPASLGADVTIACNSAVSNPHWIASANPAVFVFADPVFHFGPSRYAARFRSDVRRVARETDAVFVIPRRFAPLVLRRLPELAGRLIAVKHSRDVALNGLNAERLAVPQTANVLTLLMLPVALAITSHVTIAGCDGRRPSERYFWDHSRDAQYNDDLMESAFEAHPSFFRDRDYQSYYNTHCAQLDAMLSHAEDEGCTFVSATPSAIPALKRRMAP